MTLSPAAKSRLALLATFLVALVLMVIPGPGWAEPFRPDWVGLVLVYWCMAAPERVGVGTGWTLGLLLDLLYGSLLGQHAFAKTVIAFVTVKLHLKLRMFPRWQQAVSVLALLLVNQLLVIWIRGATAQAPQTVLYWMPSVIGMAIWPWLFVILRDVRRRAQIA